VIETLIIDITVSSQTVNVLASCTRGLEFISRTGQILNSVANGSPSLQHLLK